MIRIVNHDGVCVGDCFCFCFLISWVALVRSLCMRYFLAINVTHVLSAIVHLVGYSVPLALQCVQFVRVFISFSAVMSAILFSPGTTRRHGIITHTQSLCSRPSDIESL